IYGWVLGFTLVVSILTAAIFGLAPAFQSTRIDLTRKLKVGGRTINDRSHRHWLRSLLVASETALALILLIGATLMIQSFLRLKNVSPGFKKDHILTM